MRGDAMYILSLDEYCQKISDYRELVELGARFAVGDLICECIDLYGKKATGQLAHAGFGGIRKIQILAQVARTFDEEHRHYDTNWTCYQYAAVSSDPVGWIQKAAENRWSAAELQRKIAGQEEPNAENEMQKVIDRVRRFWNKYPEMREELYKELEALIA